MYSPRKSRQMDLYEAQYPLEDMIGSKEALCTLADHIIDWNWIDELYQSSLDNGLGRPAYPSRLAFGILFLKEKCGLTGKLPGISYRTCISRISVVSRTILQRIPVTLLCCRPFANASHRRSWK